MEVLSIVGQLILSLSILVTLHECGHFFPAKWFKTRVEKFYLFFNPGFELFKIQKGETEYGIGWIPFGGYVKISGMIDESMDTEQMKQPMQPWEFRAKPAWQRLIIMIGGVTVNFILGFIIYAGILWYYGETYINTADVTHGVVPTELGMQLGLQDGDRVLAVGELELTKFKSGLVTQEIILNSPEELTVERNGTEMQLPIPPDMAQTLTKHENKGRSLYGYLLPQRITSITEGKPAEKMGMKKDDKIIAIDGTPMAYNHQMTELLAARADQEITFSLLRNNTDTLTVSGKLNSKGELGIGNVRPVDLYPLQTKKYGIGEAIPAGVAKGVGFLNDQLKAFGQMFRSKIKATDSLGSIVSIATMFDSGWDWERFWTITAMLSILLAFFNLLPIPALDGGYVMFLLWEVITGRKVSDKVMEYATTIGFFVLIALMIFALGLDFSRFEWIRNIFGG